MVKLYTGSLGRAHMRTTRKRLFISSSFMAAAALSLSTTRSSSSVQAFSPGFLSTTTTFIGTKDSSHCRSSLQRSRPPPSLQPVQRRHRLTIHESTSSVESTEPNGAINDNEEENKWSNILPVEEGSHNSARIRIANIDEASTVGEGFRRRLEATVTACRELGKSSLWIEVPISRASVMEVMARVGLRFHHALDETAVLNLWLQNGQSKIPEFATHNVGVGAFVVNSRDEILCVRELRRNYRPWKTPTGLTELGEQIDEGAIREVLEETGIKTKFHSLLGFRQTHGMAHNRSDLFFVCRLDPIEEVDANGNAIIPTPTPQESEIEKAEWVPLSEYRKMVNGGKDGKDPPPHHMMQHVLEVFDEERRIEKRVIESVVPGRKPNAVFYPATTTDSNSPRA
jgi:ADP-ribose pyrophosphatase YjhB (NUDIX family)